MATTTNYGWTTPDDTGLVKDGAAAIRTLGSSVDTTTKNLNPETTLGDLAYRSSTANVKTRLGLGTAGQVLQVNSGATAPEWATPAAGGGMTVISSTTASAISSLSLSSIPATYKDLLLTWYGITHSNAGAAFYIRLNNASSNYSTMGMKFADGTGSAANTETATDQILGNNDRYSSFGYGCNLSATRFDTNASGFLYIRNYASTSKLKHYETSVSYYNNVNGVYENVFASGVYRSTSAISSIDIVRVGGGTFSNIADSEIKLYGVS